MIPSAVLRSPELVQKVLKLKLVRAESGKISAEFQVEKQHLGLFMEAY
ncbi:hypothetical protein RO3G_08074 [Rhizopus delemar RA 99-880]|uniref:Uncharacterized protein n=1 Tax=Rhizopus delemar (strain RA 99-880 / ATCC MYA-4621 / FGSC 9543 / NRRL 43880) TaxID=246409 RepID=I1C4I9_RHIO9|nr:hypothetical protein RO3G_08074 [Rhizopus delemar RA 99-880]|eukprot:EIE83369.1 hypothetical protein RO3G_08074 [Rhizopus delemar RA 99-880]